jgi:hypothetical protein
MGDVGVVVRLNRGRAGTAQVLSTQRLVLSVNGELLANYLEELELALPGGPLKFWARVGAPTRDGLGGSTAEAVPFSPSDAVVARLREGIPSYELEVAA